MNQHLKIMEIFKLIENNLTKNDLDEVSRYNWKF